MNEGKDKGNEKNNGQDFLERINITTDLIEFMSKRLFFFISIWSIVIILVVFAIYFYNFSDGFSTDPSAWGQFGDYVGGILNPAFSYVALVLLLFTIIIQSQQLKKSSEGLALSRKELELTRGELKRSSDAQKEQSETLKKQLDTQNKTFEQTERSKAIEIIYGTEFKRNPREKSEAVKTFVLLERNRIAREQKEAIENRTESPYDRIDLGYADLQNLIMYTFDLNSVEFINTNLTNANLGEATLTNAYLGEATLTNAYLREATLTNAYLREATLTNAYLREATLTDADLTGANLKDIKTWREIKSIKGTNITGVKNAPEGFIEWARENGAVIDEPDEGTPDEKTETPDPFQAPKNQ